MKCVLCTAKLFLLWEAVGYDPLTHGKKEEGGGRGAGKGRIPMRSKSLSATDITADNEGCFDYFSQQFRLVWDCFRSLRNGSVSARLQNMRAVRKKKRRNIQLDYPFFEFLARIIWESYHFDRTQPSVVLEKSVVHRRGGDGKCGRRETAGRQHELEWICLSLFSLK